VSVLCRVLNVNRSTYYKFINLKESKRELENKRIRRCILDLYACGMSQSDISEQIKNLYNVDISDGLVSKIVDKITPDVTAWQNRPLDAVYPFVFIDAIQASAECAGL